MVTLSPFGFLGAVLAGSFCLAGLADGTRAQEPLPWQSQQSGRSNGYYQGAQPQSGQNGPYGSQTRPYQQAQSDPAPDPYRPNSNGGQDAYQAPQPVQPPPRVYRQDPAYPQNGRPPAYEPRQQGYIQPYRPAPQAAPSYPRQYGANRQYERDYDGRYGDERYGREPPRMPDGHRGTYSENEVVDAGHRFFGSLSAGLAKAIQWAFKRSGRPNGYILGEDAGGAFIAGLRYGEGKLYTKHFGVRRVFWQGPSIGYDFGGDGNRTMTLVYNLRSPGDIYRRFGGVQGSAYLVGGVSVQFLTADDIKLAPIRTGVGVRLGANIGYLKYTRRPTWNPF